jgi:hypothetical protein
MMSSMRALIDIITEAADTVGLPGGTLRVRRNPGPREAVRALAASDYDELRGFSTRDGQCYVWDAGRAHHRVVERALGFDRRAEVATEFVMKAAPPAEGAAPVATVEVLAAARGVDAAAAAGSMRTLLRGAAIRLVHAGA